MFDDKREKQSTDASRPPPQKLDSALRDVLHNHKGQWPRMLPREPFEAADLWVSLQEHSTSLEQPTWVSRATLKEPYAGGWQMPYTDRLVNNLRIFLALAPNDQDFVVAKIREGYPWRGDNMEFYCEIIKNTDIMREHIEEHGLAHDGLLPPEYTTMVLGQVKKLAAKFKSNLPYDKNERAG